MISDEGYLKQLVNYIKKNLAKGYTLDSLRWALVNQGYSRSEVNKAIKVTNEELAKEAPKLEEKPVIKVRREPILDEIEPRKRHRTKNFFRSLKEIFKS